MQMPTVFMLAGILMLSAVVPVSAAEPPVWNYKKDFLAALIKQVPRVLKSQDKATGRFGTGIWIVTDQNVIYPLAAAWSFQDPTNPYYHNPEVLAAIMAGGDALIDAQDANGKWVFRKKDNSTWGDIYMPWTYSRWIRAYSLIKDAMPPERRARWDKALTLGFNGISAHEFSHVQNIPAHHAMGLYEAGKVMNHPEWCAQAASFMQKVVAEQNKDGFWSENLGPVVNYNYVYVDAVGTYYAMSGDKAMLPALERSARFHANFTYPDGTCVETVDERNPYHDAVVMPNVGFSFSAEGRGYMQQQWQHKQNAHQEILADTLASFLLYGQEGPIAPTPAQLNHHQSVLGAADALAQREGPWFACLSAYHTPVPTNRWIQDRQNFVSLFHDRTGLILGGGNTKLQPLWSTFTYGDTNLLVHKEGDEQPNFLPPPGLLHVPSAARLDPTNLTLGLTYGPAQCSVHLDLIDPQQARLVYAVEHLPEAPVAAHLTFLPHLGQRWQTASGKSGTLGPQPLHLTAEEAGAWFEHNGWRVSLPPGSSLIWPVLPHNPYRKDGHAEPSEGRIVLVLPFSQGVLRHEVTLQIL
ncbi:MAG: hypothetical protein JO316_09760 [Abitibacteriaceae bacterium]|nr:hypothetical protein [Abditibacteriaceae bacterium]